MAAGRPVSPEGTIKQREAKCAMNVLCVKLKKCGDEAHLQPTSTKCIKSSAEGSGERDAA